MTNVFNTREALARFLRTYGRIIPHRNGLGFRVEFHFRAAANNATRNADLCELCLRSIQFPYRWTRTDYEPKMRTVTRGPNGEKRQRLVRSCRIVIGGSTFGAAALREALRMNTGHEGKDKMLRRAMVVANAIEQVLRARDLEARDDDQILPDRSEVTCPPPHELRPQKSGKVPSSSEPSQNSSDNTPPLQFDLLGRGRLSMLLQSAKMARLP